jgi:hypothetical protein
MEEIPFTETCEDTGITMSLETSGRQVLGNGPLEWVHDREKKVVKFLYKFSRYFTVMNDSEKQGYTSAQDPPADSGVQNATAFERWRKKAWRAAGFGLSADEKLESMNRSCEKQRDYLMNSSA